MFNSIFPGCCCGCMPLYNAACAFNRRVRRFSLRRSRGRTRSTTQGVPRVRPRAPLVLEDNNPVISGCVLQASRSGRTANERFLQCRNTSALANAVLTIYPTTATVGACATLVFTEVWNCCVTGSPRLVRGDARATVAVKRDNSAARLSRRERRMRENIVGSPQDSGFTVKRIVVPD